MKEDKQNEPIGKDEEKKSLKENELKEVSGGDYTPRRPLPPPRKKRI